MNTAIILAGGIGSRMNLNCPKQYLMINNKPIFHYCLETFQNHNAIDKIIVVLSNEWHSYVKEYVEKHNFSKICGYALAGKTRQHSIYNGLKFIEKNLSDTEVCIIHDAVRPFVSNALITNSVNGAFEKDGAMPVIKVKDTIYCSENGECIDSLLNRNILFAGQSPESFNFRKYIKIHHDVSDEEITNTTGSSEIAYGHGMNIKLITGDEENFKITTIEDLKKFESIVKKNGR